MIGRRARVGKDASIEDQSMIAAQVAAMTSLHGELSKLILQLDMNHFNTPPDSSPSTPTPTAFARLRQHPSSIAEQISTFAAPWRRLRDRGSTPHQREKESVGAGGVY